MAFAAGLIPLIPSIIQTVELWFKGKDKSGADKMPATVALLQQALTAMIAAKAPLPNGMVPTEQPSNADAQVLIQSVFDKMKASGQLGEVPAAGTLWLVRGIVTAIQ